MRFRLPESAAEKFLDDAQAALRALAGRPGDRAGVVGRPPDDPSLWLMTLRWDSVGAYRRALSAYDVKVAAVPLLSTAIDEPTAYEVLADADSRRDSDRTADHGWRRG